MSVPAIGVIFHPKFPPETLGDFAHRAEAAQQMPDEWLDAFSAAGTPAG